VRDADFQHPLAGFNRSWQVSVAGGRRIEMNVIRAVFAPAARSAWRAHAEIEFSHAIVVVATEIDVDRVVPGGTMNLRSRMRARSAGATTPECKSTIGTAPLRPLAHELPPATPTRRCRMRSEAPNSRCGSSQRSWQARVVVACRLSVVRVN